MNVIVIEGGIASGKTHILEMMRGAYICGKRVVLVKEPVREWCSTPHGNLLKMFNEDKSTHAFAFQVLAMTTLADQRHEFCETDCIYFVERSLDSAYHVFQPILQAGGFISVPQGYVLKKLYKYLSESVTKPRGIIYLDTPIDIAFQRLRLRGKEADSTLTKDYLVEICLQYKRFLSVEDSLPVLNITPEQVNSTPPTELISRWIWKHLYSGR